MNESFSNPLPSSTNIILTTLDNHSYLLSSCSNHETISNILQQLSSESNLSANLLLSHQIYLHYNSMDSAELISCSTANFASKFVKPSFQQIFDLFQSPWVPNFLLNINSMLLYLRPAMTTLLQQKITIDHIVKTFYKCLGTIAFPIGVAITHVLLPDEKVEMTVLLPNPVDPKWQYKFHEALLPDNPLDNPPQLHSLHFNPKDKSASLAIGDLQANISVNDIAALYNSALYEDVDGVVSGDGLMKSSYFLIKSWIVNDSDILTVKLFPAIITGRVLQVLVFHIFCRYGHLVSHPFVALVFFLHHYSAFDFENSTIDLDSGLEAYSEMMARDPTLEMKFHPRTHCTAASVQTLIASCVGGANVDSVNSKGEEVLPSSIAAATSGGAGEEHPYRSKQHHPCTPQVMIEKIKVLLNDYRSRYESTLIAYTRILEDPNLDPTGAAAGLGYGNDHHYHYFEDPHSGLRVHPSTKVFQRSFMNVVDPICGYHNLTENITASDVRTIHSVFFLGLQKILSSLEHLNNDFNSRPPPPEPQQEQQEEEQDPCPGVINKGTDCPSPAPALSNATTATVDPFENFMFHIFPKTRQIAIQHKIRAVTVHDLAFIEQLKKNPCYRDNAIISPPDILLKQGEFILMGIQNSTGQLQITPTAVANLIVQCLERFGPQLVGDIGKQLQDLTGIPNLPKILKAKYRGLKKVIEAFPNIFQIGTDHIINPTIYLKDPRKPGPLDVDSHSPNGRLLSDYVNVPPQSNSQFQQNRNSGQQSGAGLQSYSHPSMRSNQDNSKWRYSNSRQSDNYYRGNASAMPGSSGGYHRNNLDRGGGMMHNENDEMQDPDGRQYYYDQYGGYGSGQGHARGGQNYFNNYPPNRDSRNQQSYNPRDNRGGVGGGQQYPIQDYDYDPRWNQPEVMPRSRPAQPSHRDAYGSDPSVYQSDQRNLSRDSRYNLPPTWASYQEYESQNQRTSNSSYQEYDPQGQRQNSSYYPPRSDQRAGGGGRQQDDLPVPHEFIDEYRRAGDYELSPSSSHSQFHNRSQEKQSSGWIDIEGLIGIDSTVDHLGDFEATLDLNF